MFTCYRFDGLERWTSRSVDSWHEDIKSLLAARHALGESEGAEPLSCLDRLASYLESDEFRHCIGALQAHLDADRRWRPTRPVERVAGERPLPCGKSSGYGNHTTKIPNTKGCDSA